MFIVIVLLPDNPVSSSYTGIAVQFIATKDPFFLLPALCIALAATFLPVSDLGH